MNDLNKKYKEALRQIEDLKSEVKKYKPNLMPELKEGMFGKTYDAYTDSSDYFIITKSDKGLIVVYESGTYDEVEDYDKMGKVKGVDYEIVAIYSSRIKSFHLAKEAFQEEDFLWRK